MKISTKGYYAVRALLDMAYHGKEQPLPLSTIASRQEISQHYLEQLFMKLRKSKLVKSVRGPSGGYLLARSAKEISIGDIFRAVDESIALLNCVEIKESGKDPCNKVDECVSRLLWKRLTESITQTFNSITLDTLCREQEKISKTCGR